MTSSTGWALPFGKAQRAVLRSLARGPKTASAIAADTGMTATRAFSALDGVVMRGSEKYGRALVVFDKTTTPGLWALTDRGALVAASLETK